MMMKKSNLFRIVLLLIPAFICSWIGLSKTLSQTTTVFIQTSSSSSNHHLIDQQQQQHNNINDNYYNHQAQNPAVSSITNNSSFIDNNSAGISLSSSSSSSFNSSDHNSTENIDDWNSFCFPFNSEKWIVGPRLGNNKNLSIEFASTMITNNILSCSNDKKQHTVTKITKHILQQSICYPNSAFTNININSSNNNNNNEITKIELRHWIIRLIYLSIHWHQHSPAYNEHIDRQSKYKQCYSKVQQYNIGTYDYECPNTKFLIVPLFPNGIGANIRLAAVPALLAGIATNRVVLFLNNVLLYNTTTNTTTTTTKRTTFFIEPWTLASCTRYDYQCFFLPTTPCVITNKELYNHDNKVHTLQKNETRYMFRHGQIPTEHTNKRIVIIHPTFRPQKIPSNLKQRLYDIMVSNLLPTKHNHSDDNNDETSSSSSSCTTRLYNTIKTAADSFLLSDDHYDNDDHHNGDPKSSSTTRSTSLFQYYGSNSTIFHSALLYSLRTNPQSTKQINEIIHTTIPPHYQPEYSLGLPIRGSDKCGTESECMNFTNYLNAATEVWISYNNNNNNNKYSDSKNENNHHSHHDGIQQQQMNYLHNNNINNNSSSIVQLLERPIAIVTTESQTIRMEYESYRNQTLSSNNSTATTASSSPLSASPPFFSLYTNKLDVTQDTGYIDTKTILSKNTINNTTTTTTIATADDVMVSALSSLKLQLGTNIVLGNCCSNFHLLIKDLLDAGCGSSTIHYFQCIQDHTNPQYRICCSWDKSIECQNRWKKIYSEN